MTWRGLTTKAAPGHAVLDATWQTPPHSPPRAAGGRRSMAQTQQRTVRPHARLRPWMRGIGPGRWGLALVEAVLGYLWLVSALNKLLNAQFRPGLAHVLQGQFKGNPNQWWVALTRGLVLPHAQIWAAVVQAAELLVALGYFA